MAKPVLQRSTLTCAKRRAYYVARLYYTDPGYPHPHRAQEQIAERFALTRSTVAKDIATAKTLGYVRRTVVYDPTELPHRVKIEIAFYPPPLIATEEQLISKYRLKDALVVSSANTSELTLHNLAKAANWYLNTILHRNSKLTIALSGGRTISSLIDQLVPRRPSEWNVRLVPTSMDGFTPTRSSHFVLTESACIHKAAEKFTSHHVPCEILLYPTTAQNPLESPIFQPVIDCARNADIVLLGVGTLLPDSDRQSSLATAIAAVGGQPEELLQQGVIGSLGYNLISEQNFQTAAFPAEVPGLSLRDLRKLAAKPKGHYVIALASGLTKAAPLRAALCQGYANVIIIDETLAAHLLDTSPLTQDEPEKRRPCQTPSMVTLS